jgi:Tol biopolymer transport system component
MRGRRVMGVAAAIAMIVGSVVAPSVSATHASLPGAFVFDAHADGHQQLFAQRADGSHLRRLVVSADDDLWPSFSPDGRRVLFTRVFADGSPDAIFVVDIDGGHLTRLDAPGCGATCLGDDAEGHPWSPDGHRIAFERALIDPNGDVNLGIWVMAADGSRARQLTQLGLAIGTEDHRPSWSPDGSHLVFRRTDTTVSPEAGGLFMMLSNGSGVRRITPLGVDADDPAWSPDGSLIAYQTPPDPTQNVEQDIFTIRPDGSHRTRLTSEISVTSDGFQGSNHPSWSPDGRHLVFCHFPSTDGGADLYVMDRDGSDLRLVRHTAVVENHVDWGPESPDR